MGRRTARALLAAGGLVVGTQALVAQAAASGGGGPHESRPFFVGERLDYAVRIPKFRMSGKGEMSIDSATTIRGHEAYVLRFDVRARVGFVRASDVTRSWVDPERFAALRYEKRERHPLSAQDESVEIYPDERRWRDATGATGSTASDAPLDELSFIYYLRTLPFDDDSARRIDRHFDPSRTVTVRLVGREVVTTPAGTFHTIVVEMRVTDPRHYQGEGTIRIALSDDHCRLPVRIESVIPVAGVTTFTLVAHSHPESHHLSHVE